MLRPVCVERSVCEVSVAGVVCELGQVHTDGASWGMGDGVCAVLCCAVSLWCQSFQEDVATDTLNANLSDSIVFGQQWWAVWLNLGGEAQVRGLCSALRCAVRCVMCDMCYVLCVASVLWLEVRIAGGSCDEDRAR